MDAAEIKALIGKADDLPRERFPTPEWPKLDGHLFVRGMDAGEADEHEIFLANHTDGNGDGRQALKVGTKYVRARLAVKGLVTEAGERIYDSSEADIAALAKKGLTVVDRLYDRIRALSGIGEAAAEELEKNS